MENVETPKISHIILSPSFTEALSDLRAVRMGGITYKVWIRKKTETTDFNFFTLRGKVVSYWPEVVGQPSRDGRWARIDEFNGISRREMKFTDFAEKYLVTSFYTEDGDEQIIDDVVISKLKNEAYRLMIDKGKAIDAPIVPKIVEADEDEKSITKIYGTVEAEANECGNLSSSCMRLSSCHQCHNFAYFYDLIHNLSIVYDVNAKGELIYRALLWKLDDGTMFLDRPYAKDEMKEKLRNWATDKGYKSRSYEQTSSEDMRVTISDEAVEYLKETGCPYMDSFRYLKGNTLYNIQPIGCEFTIQNADGNSLNGQVVCSNCLLTFDEDETRVDEEGDRYCNDCYYDNHNICENCGEEVGDDDLVDCEGSSYCENCAKRKGFAKCEDCNSWKKNTYYLDGIDKDVCESCSNEYNYCEGCSSYFTESLIDCNSSYYCEDCAEENGWRKCEDCDSWSDECTHIDSEDKLVCEDCLGKDYFQCNDCSEYFNNSDENEVHDDDGKNVSVCNECYTSYKQCRDCDYDVRKLTTVIVNNEGDKEEVCDECLTNYTECHNCNEYFNTGQLPQP